MHPLKAPPPPATPLEGDVIYHSVPFWGQKADIMHPFYYVYYYIRVTVIRSTISKIHFGVVVYTCEGGYFRGAIRSICCMGMAVIYETSTVKSGR